MSKYVGFKRQQKKVNGLPNFVPSPYNRGKARHYYLEGWKYGNDIASNNMPVIGETYHTMEGEFIADTENVRTIHALLCFEGEMNARCYSPWEFLAHEINETKCEFQRSNYWNAYEAGVSASIFADLKNYSDDDYSVE